MCGIDDENGVEFETDGMRLNVANAGKKQRSEEFAISQALAKARADFFEEPFARSVFKETNKRLDIGMKPHDFGSQLRFGGRGPRETGKKR